MNTIALLPAPQVSPHPLLMIERFLRDREGVWQQIGLEYRLNSLNGQMLLCSALNLACYGAVIGLVDGTLWQVLASASKLPLLFLLTLAVCLPMLYLFNSTSFLRAN
jgi:hypothetical protein